MLQRSVNALARFAGSVAALGAFVIAIPALLVVLARRRFDSPNPLHDIPWPWQWDLAAIGEALRSPLSNDVVVNLLIRVSLAVVWVAVAVIVVTTVVETVHLIRHRGLALPRVRGLGWAQPTARFIAAGLVALLPVMTSNASLVSAHSSIAPVTTSATGDIDSAESPASFGSTERDDRSVDRTVSIPAPADEVRPAHLHVVQRGESVYGIAETLADHVTMSTADIADAILDANLGTTMPGGERFTNPAYIEVGWELVIPAHVLPRESAVPSTPMTMQVDGTADVSEAPVVYVVDEGDTLSSIADEQLGDVDAWPAIFDENQGEMADGRTFDDPNLIVPGWELELPRDAQVEEVEPVEVNAPTETADVEFAPQPDSIVDVEAAPVFPSEPTAASTEPDEIATPESAEAEEAEAYNPDSTPSPTTPTDTPPPAAVPSQPTPPVTTAPTSTTTTSSSMPAAADGGDISDTGTATPSPEAPSPIPIEHAALLAAGVLALVGVRRRQRLRGAAPRARVPEPPPGVVATERRLRAIDPGERATRIDVAIRAAARSLVDTEAQIALLLVDQDGTVEVVLTTPARLPAPWTAVGDVGDHDQRWMLPASVPVELLSVDARQVGTPCVALVQLGVSVGRDVLIDIEACGTVLVEAQPQQAESIVTALATGLASSPYAEVAQLISVSIPHEALLEHRNAHQANSVSAALDLAASLVGTTINNDRSSFSLRSSRTGGEMWEPAVLLLGADDHDELGDVAGALPAGGHGVGIVAAADSALSIDTGARVIAGEGGWVLAAFGLTIDVEPVGISVDDLAAIVDLIDDAVEPLHDAVPTAVGAGPTPHTDVAETAEADISDPLTVEPFAAMEHSIIVRLMGGVDVVDTDGTPGAFERSKTVELIAWLATHRQKSTRSAARTALWDLDVRDATFANVVSEARRALGRLVAPTGDEEWLARTLTEQLPLHSSVVTDAQLIEERLDAARVQSPAHAIDTLRPAVEMIRDMPFAGTSYLWPDAEGITSSLVLLATGVTTELAAHALSIGDTDLVFWATGQGLVVLPGHEELIGLRMRAHARAGDLAGVRQEWESYERVIVADAWSDGEPAPKLLALRRELLTAPA